MAYLKCKCGKSIKRDINEVNPLCQKCKKELYHSTYIVKSNCLCCGKQIEYSINRREQKFCSISCSSKYSLKDRKLSDSHKESLSKSSNPFRGAKFYEVECPYLGKTVKVQGKYELKYAEFLNKNGIKWEKSRCINFSYKTDITRTYFPDFHLIDSDEFIEIKGFWRDGAKEKMKAVIEQHPTIKFVILEKEHLIELGIL